MKSKAVTTVDENGEKEKYLISSQDEFLHLFEKLVLKDEDGYRIGGYLSLKRMAKHTMWPACPTRHLLNTLRLARLLSGPR